MNTRKAKWRKATRSTSTGGECVELASASGAVAVRDSKDPDGPKLVVGRDEFAAFVAVLKDGISRRT
ncbi:DUF397 domain-containing protein [Actinomadura opuntiae]|uniref:DUF397 domain-containing protein n=1 Tax=Actinomadura sp. OS1-43 TaxID=604315 RepID=UPI00255A8A44|nr:DUF397 domain-containing protein [Actinomadura sp. OS1-43]MDL4814604.1 DUF397 domain-containing protein [Actinomadura sp. OS1-43]